MSDCTAAVGTQRSALWWKGAALLAVVISVLGLLMQSDTYLNHDIAWILYSTGRMLQGAVFGRDIIESNPPLAWYLSLPVAALADELSVNVATVFRAFVAVVTFGALAFAARFLRREPLAAGRATGALFLVAAAYCFFIGSYRDFGQREYLALAMGLPYLLTAAARMDGAPGSRPTAIAAGVLGGIGLALKPYFLAVPLLVELAGAYRTRSLWFPLRPDFVALCAVIAVYCVSLPLATPSYLFEVVPLMQRIYWAFNAEFVPVMWKLAPEILGFLLLLGLAMARRPNALQLVLLAAAGGFLVAYVVQMKGYTYHGFPFRALVVLALALHAGDIFAGGGGAARRLEGVRPVLVGSALLVVLGLNLQTVVQWYEASNRRTGANAARADRLVEIVERHAGEGPYLALSTHPFPGFPVAIYAGAEWASRTNSRFFLPAVARLRAAGRDDAAEALGFAEGKAHEFLRHDLAREPRLVLVDVQAWKHGIGTRPFDILAFYLEDPQIAQAWRRYRELDPVAGYRVFLRRDEGAPD